MLTRRYLLSALVCSAAMGPLLTACGNNATENNEIRSGSTFVVTEADKSLLTIVTDIVLPATSDGPAGSVVGVPEFVLFGLKHGLDGTRDPANPNRPANGDYFGWLRDALDAEAGANFTAASPEERFTALAKIDEAAFASRNAVSPWKLIKGLMVTGYYTSEVGASEVLRWDPAPGRFDPKVKKLPGMKAISNDWTAVRFG